MKLDMRTFLTLLAAWTSLSIVGLPNALAEDAARFEAVVAPFLKQHCVRCHGAKTHESQLMLHKMIGKAGAADARVWEAVLAQLEERSMPPEDQPQPQAAEIQAVSAWIRETLAAAPALPAHELIYPKNGNYVSHDLLFAPQSQTVPATAARIWRVRPSIYESFVEHASREPFHHPFKREGLFSTPWGLEGDGFKDYSALYWIGEAETELLISNAMRTARLMTRKRSPHDSESLVFKKFLLSKDKDRPSEAVLDEMVATAFEQVLRRRPTNAEASRYQAFMKQNIDRLGPELGLHTTLAALFLHPKALFRFELGQGDPDKHGRVRLAPSELAYAIAFTLTDNAPDKELVEAASGGALSTAKGIRAQVTRIIDNQLEMLEEKKILWGHGPRPNSPVLRFFQEYFGYTRAPQVFKDLATKRKAELAGNYSPEALVHDTNLLVAYILQQDKDVFRELLTTNKSFVATGFGRWNGYPGIKRKAAEEGREESATPFDDRRNRINEHYNIRPEQWSEEMPFALDKTQRAGILTQPSWLIANSTNFENHAIHRGKWVRERLLGGTIPNTPITVDAQLPDDDTLTLRQKMRVTREAFCWKCHQQMDPLGLSFEMYDHFGRFRESELGKPVETTGAVQFSGDEKIDGPVDGAVELMHNLASSRRVQQVFVRHVFRFYMGRNETVEDAPTLIAADQAYTESGGSMKALVASLLSSDSFVYRRKSDNRISKSETNSNTKEPNDQNKRQAVRP